MTSSGTDIFLPELYFSMTSFLGGQHKTISALFTELLAIMDAQLTLMEMDVSSETPTYKTALSSLQNLSANLPGAACLHQLLRHISDSNGPDRTSERIKTLQELHKLVADSRNTLEAVD